MKNFLKIILLSSGIFILLQSCKKEEQTESPVSPGIFDIVWSDFERIYPELIIVGDTTGGASANPQKRVLPNGWQ